jgi:hypothetical protein
MPETLLSPSNIVLYGRVITDLSVVHPANPAQEEVQHRPFVAPREGQNLFLQRQLEERDSQLARIYAFSYEGRYYDLPKPALFLVHGPGEDPDRKVGGGGGPRAARGPDEVDRTGVGAQEYSFSDDMKAWSYDKGDFSIRLDVETGSFEQILLDAILMPEIQSTAYSGAHARISGAHARLSGAHARLSGAHARLSGNSRGGNWSD